MNQVLAAYDDNVKKLLWVDDRSKETILSFTEHMQKFIGYHDKLATEGNTYYDNLRVYPQDEFFNIAISLKAFEADRQFKKKSNEEDWVKYSVPHTVNAAFNDKDRSIQFTAGILQV